MRWVNDRKLHDARNGFAQRLLGASGHMRLRVSSVVDVPFVFRSLREAVTLIESIGWAVAQCSQVNRHLKGIGSRQELSKHLRAHPTGLTARMHVKVVQVKAVVGRTERVEANPLAFEDAELGVLGIERLAEAFARTLWVEAPHTLQTVAHRRDTKDHKLVEINHAHGRKRDGGVWLGTCTVAGIRNSNARRDSLRRMVRRIA